VVHAKGPLQEKEEGLFVQVFSEDVLEVAREGLVVGDSADTEDVVVSWDTLDHQVLHHTQLGHNVLLQRQQVPAQPRPLSVHTGSMEAGSCDGLLENMVELLPPALGAAGGQEGSLQQQGVIYFLLPLDDPYGGDEESRVLTHQPQAAAHNVPQLLGQALVELLQATKVGQHSRLGSGEPTEVQLGEDVVPEVLHHHHLRVGLQEVLPTEQPQGVGENLVDCGRGRRDAGTECGGQRGSPPWPQAQGDGEGKGLRSENTVPDQARGDGAISIPRHFPNPTGAGLEFTPVPSSPNARGPGRCLTGEELGQHPDHRGQLHVLRHQRPHLLEALEAVHAVEQGPPRSPQLLADALHLLGRRPQLLQPRTDPLQVGLDGGLGSRRGQKGSGGALEGRRTHAPLAPALPGLSCRQFQPHEVTPASATTPSYLPDLLQ